MNKYKLIVSKDGIDLFERSFPTWLGAKRKMNQYKKMWGNKNVRMMIND